MSDREEFRELRDAGLKVRHETRLMRADLAAIRKALELLPATCRYHGEQFARGIWPAIGEACCDTGAPALARRNAELSLERLEVSND